MALLYEHDKKLCESLTKFYSYPSKNVYMTNSENFDFDAFYKLFECTEKVYVSWDVIYFISKLDNHLFDKLFTLLSIRMQCSACRKHLNEYLIANPIPEKNKYEWCVKYHEDTKKPRQSYRKNP